MADAGRIPGPIIIPNGIEVDLVWNIEPSKQVKNVLHGTVAGGFTPTAPIAQAVYAAIIASAAWTAYKVYVNAGCSLQGVNLRDLRSANNPLISSTGAATAGTGAGLALPAGVSAVVKLSTAGAGRANRGRVYLPGLDSGVMNTNTGQFLAAFQTAANNFVAAVQTALAGQGITLALANPARQQYTGRKGAVHTARNAAMVTVTSMAMRNLQPYSQRRRQYVA